MGRKRYVVAAAAAAVAMLGAAAMAATLGGITSDNLGADRSVVASCDTDGVTTAFTVAYDATDARDEVTAVTVGGVDASCAGQTLTVVLADSSDVALDTASVVAASGSNVVSTSTPPDAELVANVHIVITG
ncbi:MAG: hypothetical protein GY698_17840 [Actinomycetia bacterium]|nr:hypothetical protein [Actinomycetes bacterium]